MPSGLPLGTVVFEILRHTPAYVWAILAALVALGTWQLRAHRVSRARLVVAPIGLAAFSLWGASLAFGLHAGVVAAWLVGMALAFAANRRLRWPQRIEVEGEGFRLEGSVAPLLLMLGIFALRYAVAVTLVFHHQWAADPLFGAALAATYGALSGLFAARAWRILQAAPRAGLAAA